MTSVNPLRVYVYDNLLLRHCTEPYQEDLANAPAEAYVVAEGYAPPWAIAALRPYYTRGYSTANVLRAYMHDHGAGTLVLRCPAACTHAVRGCVASLGPSTRQHDTLTV